MRTRGGGAGSVFKNKFFLGRKFPGRVVRPVAALLLDGIPGTHRMDKNEDGAKRREDENQPVEVGGKLKEKTKAVEKPSEEKDPQKHENPNMPGGISII